MSDQSSIACFTSRFLFYSTLAIINCLSLGRPSCADSFQSEINTLYKRFVCWKVLMQTVVRCHLRSNGYLMKYEFKETSCYRQTVKWSVSLNFQTSKSDKSNGENLQSIRCINLVKCLTKKHNIYETRWILIVFVERLIAISQTVNATFHRWSHSKKMRTPNRVL